MKKLILSVAMAVATVLSALSCPHHDHADGSKSAKDYPIHPVSFVSVKLTDEFWAPRIKTNQDVTIPIALGHCYSTGRVDNFKKAAGLMDGYFSTEFPFDDTDIYKIIEGISYSIQMYPNKQLEARMDTLIDYIGKAQEADGYLFTARTAGRPGKLHDWVGEKRWEKDPDLSHELYNAGHLYEAAVAHYEATGKRTLLDIAIKNADLLVADFGPDKLSYEPGHQIVEMGLVKMFRATGKTEYLDLAKFFLDLKGNGERGEYCQSHKPVIDQDEAVGHAVRAAYMYSGMADVAALTNNEAYLQAIDKIWDNVVSKKYYITGGIGATSHGEAFGKNYELPNMSAYCETCAAIANVYWNHRLFLLHGDSKYYDVVERTLYNGLISGIGLEGDSFFYPNPLESIGQHSRSAWFGCACCPSNVCRFIASIPGYVYASQDDKIYVNLFVESESDIALDNNSIHLTQTTNFPWEGNVNIAVNPQKSERLKMMIRIPGWAKNEPVPSDLYTYLNPQKSDVVFKVNGQTINYSIDEKGYAVIDRQWTKGDKIDIEFPMNVNRVVAHEKVEDDKDKVAIERGPIVYCLEWVDNNDKVLNAVLEDNVVFSTSFNPEKLNGIVQLEAEGKSARRDDKNNIVIENKHLTAIPYYAWANRGAGEMSVWIPRSQESTRPLPQPTVTTDAKLTASITNKSLRSVNDGFEPANSNDQRCPFYSLWPKKDSEEWIAYEFNKAEKLSSAEVYWFDDSPWGGTRIPLSWKVQYKDKSGQWKDVEAKSDYVVTKDAMNRIEFKQITTTSVRLLFQLPEKNSVGVYEFKVK